MYYCAVIYARADLIFQQYFRFLPLHLEITMVIAGELGKTSRMVEYATSFHHLLLNTESIGLSKFRKTLLSNKLPIERLITWLPFI